MASSGSWYSLTVLCCDTWRQQKNSWKKTSQNISISSWSVHVCVCVCVCALGRRENGSHRPGYKGLQQSGACRLCQLALQALEVACRMVSALQ